MFRIKEIAYERHMTAEDLARASGVKLSTLQKLWANRTKDPSYSTVRAIARALGVAVEALETEEGKAGQYYPAMMPA